MAIYVKSRRSTCFEMAFSKSEFQTVVSSEVDQIFQNWCLMEYCLLFNNSCASLYEHWRSELETHLNNINRKRVKGNKETWIREVLIKKEEFNDPEQIYKACYIKFRKENRGGLGISEQQAKEVCKRCSLELDNIIRCLVSSDITEYTDIRFPDINNIKC